MNNDLISREALKEAVKNRFDNSEYFPFHFLALIDNAPTVEQFDDTELQRAIGYADGYSKGREERPQGEWIKDEEHSITIEIFKCSHCGGWGYTHFRFCPNCGADMKGEAENED